MIRRNALAVTGTLALWSAILVASAALADGIPPRFAVTPLESLEGGSTKAYALNDAGQSTGESGTGSIVVGYHAFVGSDDGSIEDIETLEGFDISEGRSINSSGQVAGTLTYFPGQQGVGTIFRYSPGLGMVEFGTLGGTWGSVVDMNESGDVAGSWATAGGDTHAFLYTDQEGLVDLGTLGTYESRVRDVNDAGQVVGYSWTEDWDIHAFLWEDGVMQDLGTLGGDSSDAYYINADGVVVGTSTAADGSSRGFRYTQGGGMEALPSLSGMTSCTASWITDSGMITGWWQDGARQLAFCYTEAEGMIDLGVDLGATAWTGPVAANDAGEILLWAMDDQTYEVYAIYYSPETGAHDLNDLLVTELDWRIDQPVDINEAGQIVASGFDVNHYNSVLLTPVTPGDLDGDGHVDLSDLAELLAHYGATSGATYGQGDIDADGDVDIGDLAELLGVYGT